MKVFLLISILFSLVGCTTVAEYYSPQVKSSEWQTVGSCGIKFEIFKRKVADGIVFEMVGPFTTLFRLEKGKTVQFKSDLITIRNIDTGEVSSFRIEKISTGVFPSMYAEHYKITESHFSPLEKFEGTGRYEKIKMTWGAWSAFEGKEDIFRVVYPGINQGTKNTLLVEFPAFYAQGKLTEIEPIEFKWKKSVTAACLQ